MKRELIVIGFAAFTGMAFAAHVVEPPATHEPTVIGDSSRSVSPVGYTYTDPPAPFGVPTAMPTRAKAHRFATHKPAKTAKPN